MWCIVVNHEEESQAETAKSAQGPPHGLSRTRIEQTVGGSERVNGSDAYRNCPPRTPRIFEEGEMTQTIDHVEVLRGSEKFRAWRRVKPEPEPEPDSDSEPRYEHRSFLTREVHFAPDELAELWGVSTETIRSIFREEPGVLKIGKTGGKYKRGYVTLRIPETVAERVHRRLSA